MGNSPFEMSTNSTILSSGTYNAFKVDATLKQSQLESTIVLRSSHLSYWVALACGLLVIHLLRSSKIADGVNAPFYKAWRLKWMIDAEYLIRDSYNKVRSIPMDLEH